MENVIPK